jgi:hypothetical protein
MIRGLNAIPALYRGFVLHPDADEDPYVFRIDGSEFGVGAPKVAFSRDGDGVMRVHLDVMPVSLRRQPAITNPRLWAKGALTVAATGIALRGARRHAGRPAG